MEPDADSRQSRQPIRLIAVAIDSLAGARQPLQNLMNRLGGEKEALRSTNILFQNTDFGIGQGVRRSSSLDGY